MEKLIFAEEEIQKLFGHEAAEDEDPLRLKQYYFKSNIYQQAITNLPLRILVGHKGIGKSALFQIAMLEDKENMILPILIKPDDIVNINADTSDFLKTIRDWKFGLLEIIASKVLSSFGSSEDKLSSKITSYGGKIIDYLRDTLKNLNNINLDPTMKLIIEKFLRNGRINVYIDDLDRGWQGRKEAINMISALLNAVRDISREIKGLFFRIGLRSDVYYLYRTSDESTDKIEGSVIWLAWTNHEILVLLIKRIETYLGHKVSEEYLRNKKQVELARYLNQIMESRFQGFGLWENAPMYRVIMSLIRKRPRDLVKLCTLAARDAYKNGYNLIRYNNFENIFMEYSSGRLQDTINEFKSELPDIERLLMNMKPSKKEKTTKEGYVFRTDQLLGKINNICQGGSFTFSNGRQANNKQLAAFLYKINFLTARKETREVIEKKFEGLSGAFKQKLSVSPSNEVIEKDYIDRKYFEENRYLSNEFADFGYSWEVHPAYRWALQPESIKDLYNQIEL